MDFFLENPQEKYLLKMSRQNTGEHWSEFIAYKLGELLGIPCAKYEILPCETEVGQTRMAVVSENLVQVGFSMIMGNEFLHKNFLMCILCQYRQQGFACLNIRFCV